MCHCSDRSTPLLAFRLDTFFSKHRDSLKGDIVEDVFLLLLDPENIQKLQAWNIFFYSNLLFGLNFCVLDPLVDPGQIFFQGRPEPTLILQADPGRKIRWGQGPVSYCTDEVWNISKDFFPISGWEFYRKLFCAYVSRPKLNKWRRACLHFSGTIFRPKVSMDKPRLLEDILIEI